MKYPKCQTENPDGAQFCRLRGQLLKTKFTYPQCGHVNPKDFKFCNKCGHALIEPAPETPLTSAITTSFTGVHYQVKKFLGEGGKERALPCSRQSA